MPDLAWMSKYFSNQDHYFLNYLPFLQINEIGSGIDEARSI